MIEYNQQVFGVNGHDSKNLYYDVVLIAQVSDQK
jgi:hypothetical protein